MGARAIVGTRWTDGLGLVCFGSVALLAFRRSSSQFERFSMTEGLRLSRRVAGGVTVDMYVWEARQRRGQC